MAERRPDLQSIIDRVARTGRPERWAHGTYTVGRRISVPGNVTAEGDGNAMRVRPDPPSHKDSQ